MEHGTPDEVAKYKKALEQEYQANVDDPRAYLQSKALKAAETIVEMLDHPDAKFRTLAARYILDNTTFQPATSATGLDELLKKLTPQQKTP